MKRRDLIRHLEKHECRLFREGGSHSIFRNRTTGKKASVPRHNEIVEYTVNQICKQLGIPKL